MKEGSAFRNIGFFQDIPSPLYQLLLFLIFLEAQSVFAVVAPTVFRRLNRESLYWESAFASSYVVTID